ncbi:DegT/DnrJ/EryC1/StrS family aminotransferase [Alloiococcus sp. CFN-8]|uniref:DegT/DnrJ/EryC1/StrS family aminotransferase n=1 Tax=Alloiococcus sp. CFN-8 TaxID=3416081 RepID=UPI003CF37836
MEFKGIKAQYLAIKDRLAPRLQKILEEGSFIQGQEVLELERALAEYIGVNHCITCGNGTDALTLVLSAYGIGPGDCIFVPDFTFFATAEAPAKLGAEIIFVDVDPETFNISPRSLEEAIIRVLKGGSLKPKAIISVDLFGLPADYSSLEPLAEKYELLLLEDGAQGFGSTLCNRPALSFGSAATTSFFPTKPLGCYGDGGAIFTRDSALAEELYSIRAHGQGKNKYDNVRLGYNSRLDTLQAAVLLTKLEALKEYELKTMEKMAQIYSKRLSSIVGTPKTPSSVASSWAQYTIKLKDAKERNGLKRYLQERDIPTMIYYEKPLQEQKAFCYLKALQEPCPTAKALGERVLSLPIHGYQTEKELDFICSSIEEYFSL